MAIALPGQVMEHFPSQQGSSFATVAVDKLSLKVKRWFDDRNSQTLTRALAFVPFILQQAYFEDSLDENTIVIHRGFGGVVTAVMCGFAGLTESLATKSKAAELVERCLRSFFTPLIEIINSYRGDTIKIKGDTLTIYFPSVDDTKCAAFNGIVPPHGSYGLPDLGPLATAVLRAAACCIEIHKRLHMFETGSDNNKLCMRIGMGCGEVGILQVGGVEPAEARVARMEFLIAGEPLEQTANAARLADIGETCVSTDAWEFLKECVIEGRPVQADRNFHLLLRMDESKYTFPTVKYAAQLYDSRSQKGFCLSELDITRRYIPSSVFKQIECDTLQYVNEMRSISVIFAACAGLDLLSEQGPQRAQELMTSVQKICYAHEGTLNKLLIDDKGMLFVLAFGLPPLVHLDDPTRAALCCLGLVEVFKRQRLPGRFGVSTGRCYCGVCGSPKRMEYTVLGDPVNVAQQLALEAPECGILCDEGTTRRTTGEVTYRALPPLKVKSRAQDMAAFEPLVKGGAALRTRVGLTLERKICFPWYDKPIDGSVVVERNAVASCKVKVLMLCGIRGWAGISKVQDMLGGSFNRAIHREEQTIPAAPACGVKAPAGSPFAEGGLVVIEGPTGLGKIELAEHIVMHCATQFQMMPIFGTMGPRPFQSNRMAVELLRSIMGVFRHLNGTQGAPEVAPDDVEALEQVMPQQLRSSMPLLRELLRGDAPASASASTGSNASDIFEAAANAVIALLTTLKKHTAVLVVLLFEHGTSLFPKTTHEDEQTFWKMTADLAELVRRERSVAGLILCREADRSTVAVRHAIDNNAFVTLKGLSKENMLEYMSSYLNIPESSVPLPLQHFVSQVTNGNPLYVRETLDQLVEDGHLTLKPTVGAGALEKVDISSWNHTAMVGYTVCRLESLDPIQASALKMSTCFEGSFTLPDLAASNCSPWAGNTRLDLLRLFRATQKLIAMGIMCAVDPPPQLAAEQLQQGPSPPQHFRLQSVLFRTMGAAMVLDSQRRSVKRNALIDRVLKQEMPQRLKEMAAKKSVTHVPWYYERAMRRMA